MKGWKSCICLLLSVTMILGTCLVFTSCDSEKPMVDAETRAEQIEAEKKGSFQLMRSGVDASDPEDPIVKAMNEFEKTYGRPVEFITCGYDEWNQKVMASIASGAPIDVVNAGNYEFPLFAMKKYAQPIDKLVDLTNHDLFNKDICDLFLYKGEHYVAAPASGGQPLIVYYNKNMFENEGMEDPMELYEKNEWTTDKMKEIAMKFTRDTNGDGVYDQWGMTAWYRWVFFGSCAASVCKINDKGLFELNMDDNPALVEALELIQSAWYKDKWLGSIQGSIYDTFYTQKSAMLNEFTWAGKNIMQAKDEGKFAFDVGAAPFPYGKTNPDRLNYCFLDGFAILNGCAAPYSGGALIELIMKTSGEQAEKDMELIPEEWRELYKELCTRPFNSSMLDNAVDNGSALCGQVESGMDIQQAIETFKPIYQSLVDEANKIPEDKVEHDFTTIDLDFSKGGMDGILKASEAESLKVSNPGDRLAAEMDYLKYGETCEAIKTDPKKYPVWGYKSYKVSFDYQVKEIPGEASVYLFELKRDGINGTMADFIPAPEAIGSWVHAEVELPGVNDNHELSLVISGRYANSIYFKNLKIEEIKK